MLTDSMRTRTLLKVAAVMCGLVARTMADDAPRAEPTQPQETVQLFNGQNLDGLHSWLKDSRRDDPKRVFRVKDGVLHITGEDAGYLATEKGYRDYHLVVEFKWGQRTDGGKYVRNSGILLNAVGPEGGAGGVWMSSVECQLAQGCVGDLICIRGKDDQQQTIPVQLSSSIVLGPDKRPRWKTGGEERVFTNKQLWWSLHDPDFEELLDTRGQQDVESPLGDWTKVECRCEGQEITIIVNGTTVNHAHHVSPAAGKNLLQSEGFELFVRKFELHPLHSLPK